MPLLMFLIYGYQVRISIKNHQSSICRQWGSSLFVSPGKKPSFVSNGKLNIVAETHEPGMHRGGIVMHCEKLTNCLDGDGRLRFPRSVFSTATQQVPPSLFKFRLIQVWIIVRK